MRFLIAQCLFVAIESAPHFLTYSSYLPTYQSPILTPFLSTRFITPMDSKNNSDIEKGTLELEEESESGDKEEPKLEEKEPTLNRTTACTTPVLFPHFYTPLKINFGSGFRYVPFPIPGVPLSLGQSQSSKAERDEDSVGIVQDVNPILLNPFSQDNLPVLQPLFKNLDLSNSTNFNGTQTVVHSLTAMVDVPKENKPEEKLEKEAAVRTKATNIPDGTVQAIGGGTKRLLVQ